MRRTQVLLDEWHYEALKELAASRKKSVSSLIRELVEANLAQSRKLSAWDSLLEAVGIVNGGRGAGGIDRRLYRR